jgi:hypothetical protein
MPVSQIIHGDCVAEMAKMPEASVDATSSVEDPEACACGGIRTCGLTGDFPDDCARSPKNRPNLKYRVA